MVYDTASYILLLAVYDIQQQDGDQSEKEHMKCGTKQWVQETKCGKTDGEQHHNNSNTQSTKNTCK